MRLAIMILVGLFFVPQEQEPKTPAPAAEIVWKNPEGKEMFEKALAAYEEKQYADAQKLFQKARTHADGDTEQEKVALWVAAAQGARELVELERKAADRNTRDGAYRTAEHDYPKYEKTPIGERYREFVERLRKEIFLVLEDFEKPSKRFAEAQGKTFTDEAKWVHEAKHALKWKVISDPAELKLKEIPADLSAFKGVAFWMHFEGNEAPYRAMFVAKGSTKVEEGKVTDHVYVKEMPGHKGAKRVEIPFKEFTAFGKVNWEMLEDFRIQFVGKKNVTVYVDEIVLIRK